MSGDDRLTPARRQYLSLKRRHPDALLLYRMGDFYELFDDDAITASRDLHITLTSREFGRGNRVPMAGVPHHALASYLRRLLAKGHRVAIGEQLSEPGRGLVERDVVRVLSPGTVVEPGLLAARENNYLVALNPAREATGLAYVDVSTGEFAVTEFAPGEEAALSAELARLAPAECLSPEGRGAAAGNGQRAMAEGPGAAIAAASNAPSAETPEDDARVARCPLPATLPCPVTVCPPRWFQEGPARERLTRHFGVVSLEPFGCDRLPAAIGAAAAVLAYVEGTNRDLLRLLRGLRAYSTAAHVVLDPHTRRNLEITRSVRSGERAGSLLAALDQTRTAMGGRLLRRWLSRPLRDAETINRRLDVVEALAADSDRRAAALALLDRVGDLERLAGRARQGIAGPRDLLALAAGLRAAAEIKAHLIPRSQSAAEQDPKGREAGAPVRRGPPEAPEAEASGHIRNRTGSPSSKESEGLGSLAARIDGVPEVVALVERAVSDESGRMIRRGFDAALDGMLETVGSAQQTLLDIEQRERARTGIRSLKVGFNKVFGYYIEVSRSNLRLVPADYARRQTLANGERFVTPELKEWEARILRAEDEIGRREAQVFGEVMEAAGAQIERLLATAEALAELDVLATFADLAVRRRYVRPVIDGSPVIAIEGGRHPVVELSLDDGAFVPNDTVLGLPLSPDPQSPTAPGAARPEALGEVPPRLLLITGPNMAGKSTYLRQVALIVLLAHIGCFVPAEQARIGLVDRIFTRVGAQDDLAAGASTFLVEMVETAAILRHATAQSLLIFDEIGRGTSTFDGLSIAQAVVEDVHDRIGARTLFATHFHELTALAASLPAMRNYNVAAVEEGGRVVFLRRVVPGGADRSYGIHVARLAGLPDHVTARAEALLANLENPASLPAAAPAEAAALPVAPPERGPDATPAHRPCPVCGRERADALLDTVAALNLAATTPMEALNTLFSIQQRLNSDVWCRCAEAVRPRLSVVQRPGVAEGPRGYAARILAPPEVRWPPPHP
jgi:DNA mismatch repair protein MutS